MAASLSVPAAYWLDALLTGPAWAAAGSPVEIACAFASSGPAGFQPLTNADRVAVQRALAAWSAAAGVAFRLVEDPALAQIRFGYADLAGEIAGIAVGTVGSPAGIDIRLDIDYRALGLLGGEGQSLLIHEIGHALGLKHPGDYDESNGSGQPPFLGPVEDHAFFTRMSYNLDVETWDPALDRTLGGLDIAAIQALYGPAAGVNVGNSLYRYASLAWPATLIGDAGGDDFLDAGGSAAMRIDLRPGARSQAGDPAALITSAGQVAINLHSTIEHAAGGDEGDRIQGNAAANALAGRGGADSLWGDAGNDSLLGGRGDDSLDGGAGDDLMVGGAGSDHFVLGVGQDTVIGGADGDELHVDTPRADWLLSEVVAGSGEWLLQSLAEPGRQLRILGTEAVVFTDAVVLLSQTTANVAGPGADVLLQGFEDTTLATQLPGARWIGASYFETQLLAPPAHGQAAISADGRLYYTPDPDYHGGDSLRVAYDDGSGHRSEVLVTIQVTAVNDAPRARDMQLLVAGGSAGGSLAAANDAEAQAVTYSLAAQALHGTVVVQANGSYSYQATNGFSGWDTFRFRIADTDGASREHVVDVHVFAAPWNNESPDQFPLTDAVMQGSGAADVIYGGAGADTLDGGAAADTLFGGDGADFVRGGTQNDLLDGETGNDSLLGDAGDDSLFGESGADLLDGGLGNDVADGGAGDDSLVGGDGADSLYGGAGDDLLQPGAGDDLVVAGDGDESVNGDAGHDNLFGEGGSDTLLGGDGNDQLSGDDFDTLTADAADRLDGGAGNDTLNGNGGDDALVGADGNDTLNGRDGADTLFGGAGDDGLFGEAGPDWLEGGDGNNLVDAGGEHDVVRGGSARDTVFGGQGDDAVAGGAGDDILDLGAGNDSAAGGTGIDALFGGAGNDVLIDGPSVTFLVVVDGDDVLIIDFDGQVANFISSLRGGAGTDTVVLRLGAAISLPPGAAAEIDALRASPGEPHRLDTLAVTTEGFEQVIVHESSQHGVLNIAPWSTNAVVVVTEDGSLSGTLPAGLDLEGQAIGYTLATAAQHGTATVQAGGGFVYTPAADFNGSDSFSFRLTDALGAGRTYTVGVTVLSRPDAPRLVQALAAQSASETQAFAVSLPAQAFVDADGDGLTHVLTLASGEPLPAWLVFDPTALQLSGTPPRGSAGALALRLSASDGGTTTSADLALNIAAAANAAPLAAGGHVEVVEEEFVVGRLAAAVDADGDPVTYTVTTPPENGTLVLSPAGSFEYRAADGFHGDDAFTFTVSDGRGGATTYVQTISIAAGSQVVVGTPGSDRLIGGDGRDSLIAGEGDDVLIGGPGRDTLDGGAGYDIAHYLDAPGSIAVDLRSRQVTRGSETDTLVDVEVIFGSGFGDTLRGLDQLAHERGDTLRGAGGNDSIDGGGGVDMAEYTGNLAGYQVVRSGSTITVTDIEPGDGVDGSDTLQDVERLVFADRMLAFGSRAEQLARVAFVLWTPEIVASSSLFARGLSYYDNGSYDFAVMCAAALTFHPEQGLDFALKLFANVPGHTRQLGDIQAIMNNAGGGEAGRVAALMAMANDPATTAQLEAKGVLSSGLVADLSVPGFGTLFQLWPGA